jgi:3-hydroxyisobutyrate dehydrogenase-like beta-hydroxyacid dehydrogenase
LHPPTPTDTTHPPTLPPPPTHTHSSTVNPDTARKLAQAARKVRLDPAARTWPGLSEEHPTLVDAPVSGGVIGAEAGERAHGGWCVQA